MTMTETQEYIGIIGSKADEANAKITVRVIEKVEEKWRINARTLVENKKKRAGCRQLVESNASLPRATPSVHLHTSSCTCSSASLQDQEKQQQEDAALVRRIQAASAVCLAKSISGSPRGSPKVVSIAAFHSVSRWFSGTAPDKTVIAHLCFACDALDITKAARLIFEEAVPINNRSSAGIPPLIAAVRSAMRLTRPQSHLAMISFLLDAGADPNSCAGPSPISGTMSALAAASSLGLREAVKLLLDRGAAVDAKLTTIPMFRFTGHNLTALHVAVFAGQASIAQVLLSHGGADAMATFDGHRAISAPEPNSSKQRDRRTWTTGITPLHLADDNPFCTELLLRHGADPEARDGWGRTPLHWAMSSGNAEVVNLLLGAGTPVDVMDDDGATPLALLVSRLESGASRQGHPEIVRMLLADGANPDLRYPQDLSVKARLLLMEEWQAVYAPIFQKWQLGSPCLRQGWWS